MDGKGNKKFNKNGISKITETGKQGYYLGKYKSSWFPDE